MSGGLVIDSLINLFGLLGLIAMIFALGRRSRDPLRARWRFALGLIAALYLFRGLYWATRTPLFDQLTFTVALIVPTAALLLAEGLIRRHAPLPVKLLVPGGAVAVLLWAAIADGPATSALGGYVGAALLLIGITVATGMRGLAPTEQRAIGALGLCLLLLIPAAMSDFRAMFPESPARLSPLALLVFGWVGLNSGTMRRRQRVGMFILMATLAGVAGIGLAGAGEGLDAVAASAVILAAFLLLSIGARVQGPSREGRSLRDRLVAAPLENREGLMAQLAQDPLIGGGVLLTPAMLADHDLPGLRLLLDRPVLRLSDAPWGCSPTDLAVESALSLFESHHASHLLVIEEEPLTLLAIACPSIAVSEEMDMDLALAQRLIRLAPSARQTA